MNEKLNGYINLCLVGALSWGFYCLGSAVVIWAESTKKNVKVESKLSSISYSNNLSSIVNKFGNKYIGLKY